MADTDILQIAAAGMDAQRSALDLAARNVAAAQTDGPAFERLVPRYAVAPSPESAATPDGYEPEDPSDDAASGDDGSDDASAAPIRYLGAVAERGSTVDAITEMVSGLDAYARTKPTRRY